jgi:hypothetical protein
LTNGTEYTFKVRAVNANGAGAESTAKATPTAGATGGTWVKVANPAFGAASGVSGIAYGGGKFVAVGNNSEIAYSTDGINWTAVANTAFTKTNLSGNLYGIADIAYGGGKFVAVGGGNQMAYSTDGINWTAIANTAFLPSLNVLGYDATNILCVTYGNGKFVAGGWCSVSQDRDEHGAQMAYSTDGINWTNVDATIFGFGSGSNQPYYTNYINSIVYENGRFVAGGKGIIANSADGINWTAAQNPFHITVAGSQLPVQIYDIAYGGGKYVAVGQNRKMAYSADGTNWTEIESSTFGASDLQILSVAYGNGRFYAASNYGKMRASTDGINWTNVDIHHLFGSGLANDAIRAITYSAGKFVAVGSSQESPSKVNPVIAYCND